MPLGIDSATPLSGNLANGKAPPNPINWNQLVTWWETNPAFACRYFSGHWKWVRGELSGIPPTVASSLKYICPLTRGGAAGELHGTNFVLYASSPLPYDRDPMFAGSPFFPRQEGWQATYVPSSNSFSYSHRSDSIIRGWGTDDAMATCDRIISMLSSDPTSGAPADLKWGAAPLMFVLLNVEPQTKIHPAYWDGWSNGIVFYTSEVIGLGNGFLPGLYCTLFPSGDSPGAAPCISGVNTNPFIQNAFTAGNGWGASWIPLMGLQWNNANVALPVTDAQLQPQWPSLVIITDCNANPKTSFSPPVVIWQYELNLCFVAGQSNPQPDLDTFVFQIDLDCTSSTLYAGRPVTDYLLQPA